MRRCSRTAYACAAGGLVALATVLAGCSDIYLDRRETIALAADDAVASNRVVQTVDPWPPAAADKTSVYNGDKMRSAAERYRSGKIIQPQGLGTTSTWAQQQQTQSGGSTDTDIGTAKSSK